METTSKLFTPCEMKLDTKVPSSISSMELAQGLVNDALYKVNFPFRKYRKYCVGISDMCVVLRIPQNEFKLKLYINELEKPNGTYKDDIIKMSQYSNGYGNGNVEIHLFIKDFRCKYNMTWNEKSK